MSSNDKYNTTNFALIQGEIRIYGRDELGGKWHRHPVDDPTQHDMSTEEERAVSLSEFLDGVEKILTDKNLL